MIAALTIPLILFSLRLVALILDRIWTDPVRILDHRECPPNDESLALPPIEHSMVLDRLKALRCAPTGFAGAFGVPDTACDPCFGKNLGEGGGMVGEEPFDVLNGRSRVALFVSDAPRRARSGELMLDENQGGPEMIVDHFCEDHIGRPQLVPWYESSAATVCDSNTGSLWPSLAGSHWPSLDKETRPAEKRRRKALRTILIFEVT